MFLKTFIEVFKFNEYHQNKIISCILQHSLPCLSGLQRFSSPSDYPHQIEELSVSVMTLIPHLLEIPQIPLSSIYSSTDSLVRLYTHFLTTHLTK